MSTGSVSRRLADLGITVPPPPPPVGVYVPAVKSGNLVYCSGVGPRQPDGTYVTGHVGGEVTLEAAQAAARLTGIQLLASVSSVVDSLEDVTRVVKVHGMVLTAPGFTDTPGVIDGCSRLLVDVFGDAGRSARSAVGVAALPLGICVEIEAIFEVAG